MGCTILKYLSCRMNQTVAWVSVFVKKTLICSDCRVSFESPLGKSRTYFVQKLAMHFLHLGSFPPGWFVNISSYTAMLTIVWSCIGLFTLVIKEDLKPQMLFFGLVSFLDLKFHWRSQTKFFCFWLMQRIKQLFIFYSFFYLRIW